MQNRAVFQKSPWKAIFSLSIPSLISIVVMMLYNMADMYFVGWLGDVSQVASVSLAMPVFSVLMAISTMIGNGVCTKIAQALGKKDSEQIRSYTALCVWACILIGAVFAVLCGLFCNPLLKFLGANDQMWEYTRSYVLILAFGAPIILLNHSLGGALRGQGAINAGMLGGMLSTVANIILDPIFILVLKLGVGGAAAATVLGNAVAVVYYLVYRSMSRERCIIEFCPRYARDLKSLGSILALGLPNAISSVLSGFAGTFSNRLLVGYGTGAVAAMAAASKAVMVVTMIQMGICMGVQPLFAYCYGGREWTRLKEIIQKVLILTSGLGIILTISIYLGRGWLIGLFIKDAEVCQLGQHLVTYMILAGPFIGIYYLSTNFLQAGGNAPGASLASALRQGILLIPLLYLQSSLFQLEGIAMAYLTADGLSILITGAMAVRYYRKIKRG
ncbi:MAG: MATE family efflux transporter [Eubacteriales bacterium]|nr:MATE family efflux transporter [Eubacteriales bacterium]